MTPREYWTACRLHDWTYMYSDDPGVYRAGREESERLLSIADTSEEHKSIYAAWHAYHFDNAAKPDEPKIDPKETEPPKEKMTMTYAITNTVPIPRRKRRVIKSKYPFLLMQRGDSFFAPGTKRDALYASAHIIMKRTGGKMKFKVADAVEGDVKGARAWRTK